MDGAPVVVATGSCGGLLSVLSGSPSQSCVGMAAVLKQQQAAWTPTQAEQEAALLCRQHTEQFVAEALQAHDAGVLPAVMAPLRRGLSPAKRPLAAMDLFISYYTVVLRSLVKFITTERMTWRPGAQCSAAGAGEAAAGLPGGAAAAGAGAAAWQQSTDGGGVAAEAMKTLCQLTWI